MNCPRCGNYCNDGARFCNNCGAQLPNAQQQNPQNPGYQQPNYQNSGYQQPNYQNYGYQQPQYNTPVNGGYHAPVKNRNIALCLVLSIITCGIYGIYWMICLADDLNVASGRPGDTSGGMVFLFTLVTCGIYSWFWLYKCGEKVAYIKQKNTGIADSNSSILYLILALFGLGIVDYCLIQSELNNVATLQ